MTDIQQQFLTVLPREEAIRRFVEALDPKPLGTEALPLDRLRGRVLAQDVRALADAPPFDRSSVDGYAVRAADIAAASADRPAQLVLSGETIACGHMPGVTLAPGMASQIATGGPIPRGADAVVMVEQTELAADGRLMVRRPVSPGQNLAFAGSDIARGQAVLAAGTVIGPREIAMLSVAGHGTAEVWRRPRVAVLSTGDELVPPGQPLLPAGVYDSNGPMVAAALEEVGCEPVPLGTVRDDPQLLAEAMRRAHATCDAVILSGGTSKGAGDLTWRLVGQLGRPGIITHGVQLKPGKPLCLAVCDGKPVVLLPGFPTSAMFTFHNIVAPVFRQMAGLPAESVTEIMATVPVRIASELGRAEFAMVALSRGNGGMVAQPIGKGSGAVTSFAEADGFVTIEALADELPAGSVRPVTLFSAGLRVPDLVIAGSHCLGLDAVVSALAGEGIRVRVLSLGSLGGLQSLLRGECDLAPMHLMHPDSGRYNVPWLKPGFGIVPGWRRMQGVVHRRNDVFFAGLGAEEAIAKAVADPDRLMVNRNQGAGTRLLLDRLLGGRKPSGYWNQPRSHNAVAAAVAQGRADWGIAIGPAATAQDLAFLPLAEEEYDFAVSDTPRRPELITAFSRALDSARPAIEALGFRV
jgi:putative molybdopterin biosynthesis protein